MRKAAAWRGCLWHRHYGEDDWFMKEIFFSIFKPGEEPLTDLETLLEKFEQEHNTHVRLETIGWSVNWKRQVEMALHHGGSDVSHTGSTWVMDLARMNALNKKSITGQAACE
jgi:ABC-type glycerol-3-phosphate transport system substrate-binding protein